MNSHERSSKIVLAFRWYPVVVYYYSVFDRQNHGVLYENSATLYNARYGNRPQLIRMTPKRGPAISAKLAFQNIAACHIEH